ncbi:MAG: S1/P1 nuclease [Muribaculaceae bacterium]|nr:S1/P1 nuclease [Muribaculaceae bacterium]
MAAPSVFAWGQKGHDVTAYIAEQHLTPATRAAVDSLLQGKSMVYWANWLDNASHTRPYAYTKTWHYKNIDAGERYEEAQANPAGDAVLAIKAQLETLQDPHKSFDDKQLAMKILVHVVGDIHQPMHMGHATDLGGNRVKVKFFGRDNNLHAVWDSNIVDSGHKWGFTEWQMMIDRATPEQEAAIISGSIDDWAKQSVAIAAQIYEETPEGTNLSYNEVARWTPVIEDQLLNGGLRLAHLLNTLFDPEY